MFKRLFGMTLVGLVLWFASVAAVDLYCYFRLNCVAEAEGMSWQVVEISSSAYALEASYRVEGHESRSRLGKPYYLNRPSAEKAAREKGAKQWAAWYRASDPRVSSLERGFPYKSCVQTLAMMSLCGYLYVVIFLRKWESSAV